MSKTIKIEKVEERLDIQKCNCMPTCMTYGFKQGTFYQGAGFDKNTAERVAASYNASIYMDDPKEIIAALIALARDVESIELHHEQHLSKRATEILSHIANVHHKEVR